MVDVVANLGKRFDLGQPGGNLMVAQAVQLGRMILAKMTVKIRIVARGLAISQIGPNWVPC